MQGWWVRKTKCDGGVSEDNSVGQDSGGKQEGKEEEEEVSHGLVKCYSPRARCCWPLVAAGCVLR